MPLKPITQTGELATSALKAIGARKEDITNVKQRASQALKISSQDFKSAVADHNADEEKQHARFAPAALLAPEARSPPRPTAGAQSSSMPDLS